MANTVVFRVDSSDQIGTGHVVRCLTLAKALKQRNVSIKFISRSMYQYLQTEIIDSGFALDLLDDEFEPYDELAHSSWLATSQLNDAKATIQALGSRKVDWIVVDHYALDYRWESALRQCTKKLMAIDDLADRRHDCDLLLDQNFYVDMYDRYIGLVQKHTQNLLGPKYALLRQEFADLRTNAVSRSGIVRRLLVCFGGVDKENHTQTAIEAIVSLNLPHLIVDVVIGSQHPQRDEIALLCEKNGYICHIQTNKMADIILNADLAITAGGIAVWERACLGLPAISIPTAPNQNKQIKDLAHNGFLYWIDSNKLNLKEKIKIHLPALLDNSSFRDYLSTNSMKLVDGRGVSRVLRAMLVFDIELRLATKKDSERLFAWRNHPSIRRVSTNQNLITKDTHDKWFSRLLSDQDKRLLIGVKNGVDIGVIRFDIAGKEAELSIYMVPDSNNLGKGLGAELLAAGEAWISNMQLGLKRLKATVLESNNQSTHLFESAGYYQSAKIYYKDLDL